MQFKRVIQLLLLAASCLVCGYGASLCTVCGDAAAAIGAWRIADFCDSAHSWLELWRQISAQQYLLPKQGLLLQL